MNITSDPEQGLPALPSMPGWAINLAYELTAAIGQIMNGAFDDPCEIADRLREHAAALDGLEVGLRNNYTLQVHAIALQVAIAELRPLQRRHGIIESAEETWQRLLASAVRSIQVMQTEDVQSLIKYDL